MATPCGQSVRKFRYIRRSRRRKKFPTLPSASPNLIRASAPEIIIRTLTRPTYSVPKPLPYTIHQVTNGNDTPILAYMNIYDDHREWLDNISPESSLTNAARRIDTTVGTLSRFLKRNGNKFDADYIIRISIAYGINPAQALAETGLIPAESLTVRPPTAAEKRKLLTELLNEVDED